ncbi:MAG: hypothetical protein GX221_02155 [Candidatus Riflebacteria bacterium]|nr:hypothetical protein [Candidatus Riflebacteria bacterium]
MTKFDADLYDSLKHLLSDPLSTLVPKKEDFYSALKPDFHSYKPTGTLKLSVSGSKCEQRCNHCNARYLASMVKPKLPIPSDFFDNFTSILVSGGSDKDGAVNLSGVADFLNDIPDYIQRNFHVGWQRPLEAFQNVTLRETDCVSFDLPVSDKVFRDVFRLPYTAAEAFQLFKTYSAYVKTVPHLTIGLTDETPEAELALLNELSYLALPALVFLVFRPTANTPMADKEPPALSNILTILKSGILKLDCPIILGCMRPSAPYRNDLDILSYMLGINRIVMPSAKLVKNLEKFGIEINQYSDCCSLTL